MGRGIAAVRKEQPHELHVSYISTNQKEHTFCQPIPRATKKDYASRQAFAGSTRTRIIDDWLRDRLLADAELPVIILGAGFDARAFRMPGGQWFELDHPALIALKDEVLPAERAPNPLRRIAVDFAAGRLEDRLKPLHYYRCSPTCRQFSVYLPPFHIGRREDRT